MLSLFLVTVVVEDKVEVKSALRDCPTRVMSVMAVRLARKLPQTPVLPTEVFTSRMYVGLELHDVKVVLQLREAPCVTVQVKVTTSPGHAAVLLFFSTLDTNVTSAAARKVMRMCVEVGHLDSTKH